MAPSPVTNELKNSPIVHEEKHLFTEQSLKKRQTPLRHSTSRIISPPMAPHEIRDLWTKTPPNTRTFVPHLGELPLSSVLNLKNPGLFPHTGVNPYKQPPPTPCKLTRINPTRSSPQLPSSFSPGEHFPGAGHEETPLLDSHLEESLTPPGVPPSTPGDTTKTSTLGEPPT